MSMSNEILYSFFVIYYTGRYMGSSCKAPQYSFEIKSKWASRLLATDGGPGRGDRGWLHLLTVATRHWPG